MACTRYISFDSSKQLLELNFLLLRDAIFHICIAYPGKSLRLGLLLLLVFDCNANDGDDDVICVYPFPHPIRTPTARQLPASASVVESSTVLVMFVAVLSAVSQPPRTMTTTTASGSSPSSFPGVAVGGK